MLSIIVLNWNRAHYTKRTVECLLERTTVPHEFVFVDNSSTEESGVREYLKNIKGNQYTKDIKLVFNSKNLGVSGGRNSGLIKAVGDYLFNIDDDVLVPQNYDKCLMDICDKVPRIGLTGINVEPSKYPVVEMNGVKVQYKQVGNLGGAALCLPRRIFKIVGYYGFGQGSLYGHEDSYMRYKLDILGLIGAYIVPRGIHLDKDIDKKYRAAKNNAHVKGSLQLHELSKSIAEMRRTKNVYTPYIEPENYHPVDESIFTNDLIKKG